MAKTPEHRIASAAEARKQILDVVEFAGRDEVLDAIVQFNNTTENDISDEGNIWVGAPQTGHWLDDDRLIAFAKFIY